MIEIPPLLLAAIEGEVRRCEVPLSRQIAAVRSLFELFTTERSRLGQVYLDQPRLRTAYLRYHVPLNIARAMFVLEQVRSAAGTPLPEQQIIDLGGGPGSAGLGTLLTSPSAEGRLLTVYDQSRGALKLGEHLVESMELAGTKLQVGFQKHSLPALPRWDGPAVVWLAMTLNELARNRRFDLERFAQALGERCPVDSVLIITEPALRQPGRGLLQLHDLLVARREWDVVAPCTHQQACPLLPGRERSWCHFRFSWRVPKFVMEVAGPLGLECETPSVAYLALRRIGPRTAPATSPTGSLFGRVIGDPMPVQGGKQGVYICVAGERRLLTPVGQGITRGSVIEVSNVGDETETQRSPRGEAGRDRRRSRSRKRKSP